MIVNRKILFHANRLRLSGCISEFENKIMAEFFGNRGWNCFFADWIDINSETLQCSYAIHAQTGNILRNIYLYEIADVIVARKIGSVESRIEQFKNYLQELIDNFQGIVINDPKAMIYGMRKDYIFLLQEQKFPVISLVILKSRFLTKVYFLKLIEIQVI